MEALNVEETAKLILKAVERSKDETPEAFLEETGMSQIGFEAVGEVLAKGSENQDPVAREQAAIQVGYQLRRLIVEKEEEG